MFYALLRTCCVAEKEYDQLHDQLDLARGHKGFVPTCANFPPTLKPVWQHPLSITRRFKGLLQPKQPQTTLSLTLTETPYFLLEGNDLNVMYYLQLLHHSLEEEYTHEFGGLVAKAGITHVVLHRDYPYNQERLENYRKHLLSQTDLELKWENDIASFSS